MAKVDIHQLGLTHAQAVAALFNRAQPQGMGKLHFKDRKMDVAEAESLLAEDVTYFDYHEGRVMKVRIDKTSPHIETALFDRDNGIDAALEALQDAANRK